MSTTDQRISPAAQSGFPTVTQISAMAAPYPSELMWRGVLPDGTRIDYARELALIAVVTEDSHEKEIAVARYVTNPDGRSCEFAIAVADAWQHRRIGRTLMICLMRAAHRRGLQVMEGFVLSSNHKMLGLMHALGFTINSAEGDPTMKHVSTNLTDVTVPALPESAIPAA